MSGRFGKCRGCPATVLWARMPSGKNNPLDVEPMPLAKVLQDRRGVVAYNADTRAGVSLNKDHTPEAIEELFRTHTFHVSHFGTCPNRQRFARNGGHRVDR